MPNEPDQAQYLEPYREAADESGARFEALLWKNPDAQIARFDAVIDSAELSGRAVADLGCGLADFHARLVERNVGHARYIGVEAIGQLADASREKLEPFGSRRAEVVEADFVADADIWRKLVKEERCDVLVFSGSLNTLSMDDALRVLDQAWAALRERPGAQLVFNFLSDRCEPGRRSEATAPAVRFDTLAVLDWALERTPTAVLRHDYLGGHDAMVVMTAPGSKSD